MPRKMVFSKWYFSIDIVETFAKEHIIEARTTNNHFKKQVLLKSTIITYKCGNPWWLLTVLSNDTGECPPN